MLGTGKHPFGDLDSLPEIMRGLMSGEHEPWPRAGELGALIERGLAADPDERPSPAELVAELTKLAKA